jgi:hypothetical protein
VRFGGKGSTLDTLASDIFHRFAAAFPYQLKWSDRRSIGEIVLASVSTNHPTNPRGWWNDPTVDITTPEGIAALHTGLLHFADGAVTIMQAMNSQGMITWDIEGEQFPGATYVGDPRAAVTLAPELDGVIDQYFKKFTDAGLRVGVALRPQQVVVSDDGQSGTQQDVGDPAALLIEKIAYAKNRWGCTLFYIDSNVEAGGLMDAAFIERVATAFPDVLLIPEHKNTRYYASTAPYTELRVPVKSTSTPASALSVYNPAAFSVINTSDGDFESNHDALLASVKRGDILMYRGWFNDPGNAKVKALYDAAAQPRRE